MFRSGFTSTSTALLSAVFVCLTWLTGCGGEASADGKLAMVATTGHIHDALQQITAGAEDRVSLTLIYAPGTDPHTDAPSGKDIEALEDAKAIFYNGLHLEAPLSQLLTVEYADKSFEMASAFPESTRLESGDEDEKKRFDPHIWNHLVGWAGCVEALAERVAELDPEEADRYRKQGKAYADELRKADAWAAEQLAAIPAERRFLVSTHDAFNYFAHPHELKTLSPLGISTDKQPSVAEMSEVVDLVIDNKVPVIFVESGTSSDVIRAIQEACSDKGWDVKVAAKELFADTLGEPPYDTFLKAFRSNVEVISGALK